MIDSVTSSSMVGAAVGLRQGQNQYAFGVQSLRKDAESQQSSADALLQGVMQSTGNTTPTRGQNVNILV